MYPSEERHARRGEGPAARRDLTEPAAVEDLELTEEDLPQDVTGGSGYDGRGDGPVFNHAEPCLGLTDLL